MNTAEGQAQTPSAGLTDDAKRKAHPGSAAKALLFTAVVVLLAGAVGYQAHETRKLSQQVASLSTQLNVDGSEGAGLHTNAAPLTPAAPDVWPFDGTDLELDHWDPRAELQRMQQDMNQLFGTSFSRFHMSPEFGPLFENRVFSPSIDVEQTEDAFLVTVDVPGVSETNINVEVENNVLHIRGETNRETEGSESKGQVVRKERFEGRFERAIPLPSEVDTAKMTTEYENGILTITLPKNIPPGD